MGTGNTRLATAKYRLSQWTVTMSRRMGSGLSVRDFCSAEGIHENTYYYWQRKLREAASGTGVSAAPDGWALCAAPHASGDAALSIEVGPFRACVTAGAEMGLLSSVCRTLASLC